MAMFVRDAVRPAEYERFRHPVPNWFTAAKLGIFVHWGPYAVPAWAEPIGALGTVEKEHWYRHNPYAEWYYNTIRIPDSPAACHQEVAYGGAPYDDFLDQWHAEEFDADAVMALVAATGARYFVPTSKHHDGVTLWDAPGTRGRNTVHRGPRRDLLEEFRCAAEAQGIRFGLYYSGGLDWHFGKNPPITSDDAPGSRPVDAAYAAYAHAHVADLIARYRPEVLWGDIEWPDAGKESGPYSLIDLFDRFYAARPEGVVNDRWGATHWDFRTSEYQHGLDLEADEPWENCRGVGYSFGYNRLEDESSSLSAAAVVRHFVDVISRGGNLLLNIGLTASGRVPELQRLALDGLGAFNAVHGDALFGSVAATGLAVGGDDPWVRWTRTQDTLHAFVVADEADVVLDVDRERVRAESASSPDGLRITSGRTGPVVLSVPPAGDAMPRRLDLPMR